MSPNSRFAPFRLEKIKEWANHYVAKKFLPGIGLLIWADGKEAFSYFTGFRDIENKKPFDRSTVVRLYSMTKPVTSLAIMQLVEQGKLSLNTPLHAIIPSFKNMKVLNSGAQNLADVVACRSPTIHEILIHTSGLTYGFNEGLVPKELIKQKLQFGPDVDVLETLVDRLAAVPLAYKPGSRWEYSLGLDVAGRVVEIVSGKTLDQYFSDHIFTPLGLCETSFQVQPNQGERLANLYMSKQAIDIFTSGPVTKPGLKLAEAAEKSLYHKTSTLSGGAGLLGTIDDYMTFAEMLRCRGQACNSNTQIIAPRTADFMMQNHLPGEIADLAANGFSEEPTTGLGFGIGGAVVLSPPRTGVMCHRDDFSWGGLASTFFWIDRQQNLSVVFFTQLTPSSALPIRAELRALVHAALKD